MRATVVWLLTSLGRLKVTLTYTAAVVVMEVMLLRLEPAGRLAAINNASTNLRNLSDGSFTTLIDSAFITQSEHILVWLPGLVVLLALAELLWRSRRLVVAFAVGHIATTLIVAAGIAAALRAGLVSGSIADAADVGMSYGAVAVLGVLTFALPRRGRAAWAGGWLALAVGSVLVSGADFTAVGHAVALALGIVIGCRFGASEPWTAPRYVLLTVASGFGYALISYGYLPVSSAAALAGVGAMVATLLSVAFCVAQTNSSALASIQSDNHPCGGDSSNSPGMSHS
ncbi:MAG TPA: hypothetical protein PK871_11205 [Mycobacterium sp.]|nr:hypothetical protein [Mycobacterium sp.]